MALLSSFTKQPREIVDFDIDYSTVLSGRTDTLSTKTVEVSPAGLTIVSSTITGNKIKVIVSLGTTGVTYKVTTLATTTAGLVYEDEVNILVEEV